MIIKYNKHVLKFNEDINLSSTFEEFIQKYSDLLKNKFDIIFDNNFIFIYDGIIIKLNLTFDYYKLSQNSILLIEKNNYESNIKKVCNSFTKLIDTYLNTIEKKNENSEINYRELYKKQLDDLSSMGFNDITKNLQILQIVDGDVQKCIPYLI